MHKLKILLATAALSLLATPAFAVPCVDGATKVGTFGPTCIASCAGDAGSGCGGCLNDPPPVLACKCPDGTKKQVTCVPTNPQGGCHYSANPC